MPMYDPFNVMGAAISNRDIDRYANAYNKGLVKSPEEFSSLHPFVRAHIDDANVYAIGATKEPGDSGTSFSESRMDLKSREGVVAWNRFLNGAPLGSVRDGRPTGTEPPQDPSPGG